MAELADAQASGACGSNIVRVQVPLPALSFCLDVRLQIKVLSLSKASGSFSTLGMSSNFNLVACL